MRKIALLALLVLAPFYANAIPPGWLKRPYVATTVTYPLDRHGGYWADPPAGGIHLVWNGSAMVDRMNSGLWTMVGSVTQDTTGGAWYPDGIASGSVMPGAGGFSSTKYYRSTTQPGPFAFPGGNFTVCFRVTQLATAGYQRILWAGNGSLTFYDLGTYLQVIYSQGGSSYSLGAAGGYQTGWIGPHVMCLSHWDVGDGTGSVRLNYDLGTAEIQNKPGTWDTPSASYYSFLGDDGGSSHPYFGIVHEVWAGPYRTDAQIRTMVKQAFGMIQADGTEITVNRTGYEFARAPKPGGGYWAYSRNIARLGYESPTKYGLLVEAGHRHYMKNATIVPKTGEVTWTLPVGHFVVTSEGTAGTVSVAVSGTAVSPDVAANCTNVAVGVPCAFSITTSGPMAVTSTSGVTLVNMVDGWEAGLPVAYAGSGTTTTIQADAPSLTLSLPSGFAAARAISLQVTAAPRSTMPWSQFSAGNILSVGGTGAANTARLFLPVDGSLAFDAYDASNARLRVSLAPHSLADGSTHTLAGYLSYGAMSLSVDGTPAGLKMGSGSPRTLALSTGYVGGDSVSAIMTQNQRDGWNGYLRQVTISTARASADAIRAADDGITRIGVISDTHSQDPGYIRDARVQMDGWGPDALLHLGDIVDNPGADAGALAWWVQNVVNMEGGAPHLFEFGNHDIGSLTKAQQRATLPADQQNILQTDLLYGSTDIRGVHFVITDSEYADVSGTPNPYLGASAYFTTAELAWLAADIDATSLPVVVLTHRTLNPGSTCGGIPAVNNAAAVQAILNARASKIAVVLNGHFHCPESYTDASGVFYVGVGSTSTIQTTSWTTHSLGDHTQIEIDKVARTVRVGWWENDGTAGYVEAHTASHAY